MAEEIPATPAAPTVTTLKTETTSTSVGEPAPHFDDWIRAILAVLMVTQFVFMIIYSLVYQQKIDNGVLTVDVSLVTGALGYYLGASSKTKAQGGTQ